MARQFSNLIPSLNTAFVSAMNSCSLTPHSSWKVSSVGIVASPTPTVPISSDSTSLMSRPLPSVLPRQAAVIQPAVPPPAMTTRRTGLRERSRDSAVMAASAFESVDQRLAQVARAAFGDGGQRAARVPRDVGGGGLIGLAHVVVEHAAPDLALSGET